MNDPALDDALPAHIREALAAAGIRDWGQVHRFIETGERLRAAGVTPEALYRVVVPRMQDRLAVVGVLRCAKCRSCL
jgi:hypothetical protein